MSLQEHHKFILDAMDRQNAIARNFVAELEAENARLKAEVIRLQQVRGYEHYLSAEIGSMHQENVRLKAEVERLTKAGDEMAMTLHYEGSGSALEDWNKVKGVQS